MRKFVGNRFREKSVRKNFWGKFMGKWFGNKMFWMLIFGKKLKEKLRVSKDVL